MSRSEVEKLYERGRRLYDEGKYQEACQMMKEANEKGQFLAKNDLLRADISHRLAFILYKLNENAEAEIHFRIALGIKEMVMQPNDNSTAISLYMLGSTLRLQGKLEEAERVGERSINMLRVSPNKDDKNYAHALDNLAATLRQRGKFEASETMFRESLETKRRTFGKNHQQTAKTLNNLGLTLQELKKFESAEAAYRESLEIFERLYGRKHKETAITLNNLGACLNVEGKFTEAVDVLREAVSIRSSLNVSPELKELSLDWLLKSLNDDGKFQQAEEEYQRWFRFEDLPLGNRYRKAVTEQIKRSLQNQGKLRELDELKQTGQYTVQYAAPSPNVKDYSVQATAVSPTRDHRHASDTAQATSQVPHSPLQELAATKRHLAEQEEVTRQITKANMRLQQQVDEQQTQIQMLQHEISQLRQDKQRIQGQKDQLQHEKGEIQCENGELQREKGELQQRNDQLQREKTVLQQRNDQLQQEKTQLNREKEHLYQQLARTSEPSVTTGTNPRLQRRLREAETRLQEYETVLIISEEEVELTGPRLGGGSFGEVFVGVWQGVPVAVKRFHKALLEVTDHIVALLRQEVSVCSRVHHPNVVSICGAITTNGIPLHLVTELLEASLTEVMAVSLCSGNYLSFREQIDLSVDCLCGVLYLHSLHPPLLHGDIRPTNILVSAMMEAKIGDLGTAHVVGGSLSCGPVSLDYIAPERMPSGQGVAIHNTKEADVCSLGVTLAEIYTGQQASRKSRERQLSLISHELLEDICSDMTEETAENRIAVSTALDRVRPLKKEEQYVCCAVKRMVKGKLHDPNGPILVDSPWQ